MGWTSFPMHEPVKEWFKKEWAETNVQILDIAIVKRNTLYAAIKNNETNEVFCAVYLLRWSNSDYNFSYKSMTEFVGPCETECPLRIMKLLTPLSDKNDPDKWARNWREKVYKYWEDKKKFDSGFVLKTKNEISFTNGLNAQYFKNIGKKIFAGIIQNNEFYQLCRVSFNPLKSQYEILESL